MERPIAKVNIQIESSWVLLPQVSFLKICDIVLWYYHEYTFI